MVFPRGTGSGALDVSDADADPYNPKWQRSYYTNLSSMNALRVANASGPLELDGHANYDTYNDRYEGDYLNVADKMYQGCTGQGKSDGLLLENTHDWQKVSSDSVWAHKRVEMLRREHFSQLYGAGSTDTWTVSAEL